MSIGERLSHFIDKQLLISVREFEKKIKVPQGSIQRAINGSNIGVDKLQKIVAKYTELNAQWLLTGEGSMLDETLGHHTMVNEPTSQMTRNLSDKSTSDLSQAVLILSKEALKRTEVDIMRAENERKLVSMLEEAMKNR